MTIHDGPHDPDPDRPLVQAVQQGITERKAAQERAAKKNPLPLDPQAEEAFRELVGKYERRLFSYFYDRGCKAEDVRELTQESFLRVFEGMERVERSFLGFLLVTAGNVYKNYLRRRKAKRRNATEISTEDVGAGELDRMVLETDQVTRLLVQDAIAAMPPRRRQCLELSLQGWKEREIADILSIAIGSVKKHLHLARKDLLATLGTR